MAFDLSKITSLLKNDVKISAKHSVIGVDVGSSAIKIVELYSNKGVPTLSTYGELQLGPYGGVEIGRTTRLTIDKLTEALVDIMREASATANEAVLSLSYSAGFSTVITLPTVQHEEIPTMIPVEARKYVPVSLSEVTLDWYTVSTQAETKTTKVLLVAVHNEALKRYGGMLNGASVAMGAAEIEFFSSMRSVVSQKDNVVGILDIGAGSTKLYIVKKGVVSKTHSVLMSGVELTNILAQTLGIGFPEAEEMKRNVGLLGQSGDPRVQKAMVSYLERGLREIHKVIRDHESTEEVELEKIILSGSGALLTGLPAFASDMFSRPTVIANPFSKVAYPAFLEDTLEEAGPAFAVAVGAALRGVITT